MSYIGVDIGTSVIKAAMFDDAGEQCALESAPARVVSPHEAWFEQDMEEVLAAVATVVRGLLKSAAAQTAGPPTLLALTGQGDGVWLVDGAGLAVRPAVSWMDARAAGIADRWQADGVSETVFRRTGGAMFPGCPAPVLAWLDAQEPRVLDRAVTAAYCKDVVMQRLTGVRATDTSDAALPFLDPVTRTYATDVLDACGLAHRADLLAPVVESGPTGVLTDEGAALLGLAVGIPVSAGPFDLPACARGSGVDAPGAGHLIVGTTLACQVVIDELDMSGEPAGLTLPLGRPDRWLRSMPAMVGTAALDWVLALIGRTHDGVDELLAASVPGAHGVRCLPYFSPAGERAPFLESGARARLDGLTVQTTPADVVRAVCEGIAYAARHCFEAAGLSGDVAICGGGVRSKHWLRLFADVLGRPVHVAPSAEVGAYGAVLAGIAATGLDADARAWAATRAAATTVVGPGADSTRLYAGEYDRYRASVDRARTEWKERQV